MAFTAEDIAALKSAMASGISEITSASGERLKYRDLKEALQLLAMMEREVAPTAGNRAKSYVTSSFERGL